MDIVVKSEEQIFQFRIGLKDIVLLEFFLNITQLIKRESNSSLVDGFSLMTYYKFTRNGSNYVGFVCEYRRTILGKLADNYGWLAVMHFIKI